MKMISFPSIAPFGSLLRGSCHSTVSVFGHLPFGFAQRRSQWVRRDERPYVNLVSAGLIGSVGDPAAIRREAGISFVELRPQQEHWFARDSPVRRRAPHLATNGVPHTRRVRRMFLSLTLPVEPSPLVTSSNRPAKDEDARSRHRKKASTFSTGFTYSPQ